MLGKKKLQTHSASGVNEAGITRASHVSAIGKEIFLPSPMLALYPPNHFNFKLLPRMKGFMIRRVRA